MTSTSGITGSHLKPSIKVLKLKKYIYRSDKISKYRRNICVKCIIKHNIYVFLHSIQESVQSVCTVLPSGIELVLAILNSQRVKSTWTFLRPISNNDCHCLDLWCELLNCSIELAVCCHFVFYTRCPGRAIITLTCSGTRLQHPSW